GDNAPGLSRLYICTAYSTYKCTHGVPETAPLPSPANPTALANREQAGLGAPRPALPQPPPQPQPWPRRRTGGPAADPVRLAGVGERGAHLARQRLGERGPGEALSVADALGGVDRVRVEVRHGGRQRLG